MARRGQRNRSSIDSVLDDLLASEDEAPKKKIIEPSPVKQNKKNVKLTSDASDAEFYKNLKQISGKNDFDDDDEESDNEALTDDAAKRLADDIGDLDDLDNDLFAGLKSKKAKKPEEKKVPVKKKPLRKSTTDFAAGDHDGSDPLAGLLSDEDDLHLKGKHKKSLSRRLSTDRVKIEPSSSNTDSKHDIDPNNDPFMSSGEFKPRNRQSSFDDPTASESEIVSPRQQVNKNRKGKGRQRKGSVEPTIPEKEDDVFTVDKGSKNNKQKKSSTDDDLFGDSDGLPGLSDEDAAPSKPPPKKVNKKPAPIDDDLIPQGKASSALDNLLGSPSNKKTKKPTMLEQMMSGKAKKPETKKSDDADEFLFGGYAPSLGDNNRPTTAPDKRSVHFADQLGLDLNEENTRPGTAPTKKTPKNSSFLLDSSLEDSGNGKEFFSAVRKRNTDRQKQQESQQKQVEKQDQSDASKSGKKGRLTKQSSKDDWLGLGDDHTEEIDFLSSGELFSPRSKPNQRQLRKQNPPEVENNPPEETQDNSTKKEAKNDELSLPWDTTKDDNKRRTVGRRQNDLDKKSGNEKANKTDENDFLSLLKTKKQQKETEQAKDSTAFNQKVTENNTPKQSPESTQQDTHYATHQQQPVTAPQQALIPQQPTSTSQQSSLPPQQATLTPQQAVYTPPQNTITPQQSPFPVQQQTSYQQPPQVIYQTSPNPEALLRMRDDIQQDLSKQYQEDFNASKRQFEREKSYLESELRDLQSRILKIDESRSASTTNYDGKIRELETKVGKLELERDQLLLSIESMKQRHKDEIMALETSHKNRIGYLEDSYKRREEQLRDETSMITSHHEEKERAMKKEKEDLAAGHKKKCELIEQNHSAEIERLRELHKKTLEDILKEHNEQMNHLRLVKEQEVHAASSAFSQTKSLQSLMMEMQNSTKELNNLQIKIDTSHSSKLNERELSLRSRDEYLRNLENKLHAQESTNEEERQRLQNLVSKMEIQLREQTRQLEHDKWKLVQDDNRIKAMQTALDEERRAVNEQLSVERQQLAKSREEMLAEQRRIIAECYEEKRKIADERSQLSMIHRDAVDRNRFDRSGTHNDSNLEATLSRYQFETSNFNIRLNQIKKQEDDLACQKDEVAQQKHVLEREFEQLRQASLEVQKRSEEVEKFAKEASRIHEEGEKALEDAHLARSEFMDGNQAVEARSFSLEHQERFLKEERERLNNERNQINLEKKMNVCSICRRQMNPIINQDFANASFYSSLPNPAFASLSTNQIQPNPYGMSAVPNQTPLSMTNSIQAATSLTNQIQAVTSLTNQVPGMQTIPTVFSPLSNNTPTSILHPSHTFPRPVSESLSNDVNVTFTLPDSDRNNNVLTQKSDFQRENEQAYPNTSKQDLDFSVDSLMVQNQPNINKTPSVLQNSTDDIYISSTPVFDPPPDLILDNLEFKRTMRRWTSAKEKDDDFFEEEQRYLKSLQAKRMR